MRAQYLFVLPLCLLYCSTTLASSSSDSERTLSNPGSPVRHPSPAISPTTVTSAPSLSHFVRLDDLVRRPGTPARPTRPTLNVQPPRTDPRTNPLSLSAQLERSRAYFRDQREKERFAARPAPLDREAQRQQAVNVYLDKKTRRAKATVAGPGFSAGGSRAPTRPLTQHFPLTSQGAPLLAGHPISEGHPIFGPQPYRPRNSGKTLTKGKAAKRRGDADHDWTPARDRALAKKKARAKQKAKDKAMSVDTGAGASKEKATYKDKGKGKAEFRPEPRPKMRKLLHLG